MIRNKHSSDPPQAQRTVPAIEQVPQEIVMPEPQPRTKRGGVVLLILGLLILAAFAGYWIMHAKQAKAPDEKNSTASSASSSTKIRLIASGDELPHDSVNANAATGTTYNYKPFFSEVKAFFDKADIRFCNQEVPSAAPIAGPVSGYPTFNAPTEFARDINAIGCNVINTATNHTNDKHQAGIDATQNEWDKLNKLAVAGGNRSAEEQQKVRYFTVKGVKFAFLAYNYYNNDTTSLTPYGINMFDEALMSKQLAEAQAAGAYTLVSMHWGTEYSPDIDAEQTQWGQFLADHGANIVLGTGPHVLEPVKKLPRAGGGDTLVWYSLGNMLNTQLDIESLIGGFAVMDFKVSGGKATLDKFEFMPTYMHYEWTVEQKAKSDLLARKNLKLYPLDKAAAPLARSQNNTTVEAQTKRITDVLNTYITVPVITSSQY